MSVGGTSRGMLDNKITLDHAPDEVACRKRIEKAANDGEGVEYAEQGNKDEAENGQGKNRRFEIRHVCELYSVTAQHARKEVNSRWFQGRGGFVEVVRIVVR
jgi:hypothetical protein